MSRPGTTLVFSIAFGWIVACEKGPEPVGTDAQAKWLVIRVGSMPGDSTPAVTFLPPLVPEAGWARQFDLSLSPHVRLQVCLVEAEVCRLPPVAQYSTTASSAAERLQVDSLLRWYQADWRLDDVRAEVGKQYRVRVLVAGTETAAFAVEPVASDKPPSAFGSTIVDVRDERVLPIRFGIKPDAAYVVGPGGGRLRTSDDAVTLDIPAGAVERDVGITVRRTGVPRPDATLVPGTTFQLGPDSLALATPAVLTVRYDPARIPSDTPESSLRLHGAVNDWWVEALDSHVDVQKDVVTGSVSKLGTYAVLSRRPVKQIDVFPAEATVSLGDIQQMVAVPRDERGYMLSREIRWSASTALGVLDPTRGFVRALAPGTALVSVGSESVARHVQLAVDLAAFPNEPVGFTPVGSYPFLQVGEGAWKASDSPNFRLIRDELAPRSPPGVAEALFPAGWPGGYEPVWLETPDLSGFGFTKLYASFWLRLSPNWQGHDSQFNKIGYMWIHRSAVVFPVIWGADGGPLVTGLGLQDIPVVVARNLEQNLRQVEVKRGQWHRWEVLLISNTKGKADGEAHWWIHGVKVGEYNDIQYGGSTQSLVWELLTWRPVWGGRGDMVGDTMSMRLDHLYVSGSR